MGLETIREALENAAAAIQHKEEVKIIVEALRNSWKESYLYYAYEQKDWHPFIGISILVAFLLGWSAANFYHNYQNRNRQEMGA